MTTGIFDDASPYCILGMQVVVVAGPCLRKPTWDDELFAFSEKNKFGCEAGGESWYLAREVMQICIVQYKVGCRLAIGSGTNTWERFQPVGGGFIRRWKIPFLFFLGKKQSAQENYFRVTKTLFCIQFIVDRISGAHHLQQKNK